MVLYRLEIAPAESDGEGEDHDEWFGSLRAARRRRAELIRADPHLNGHRIGSDFRIERVNFRTSTVEIEEARDGSEWTWRTRARYIDLYPDAPEGWWR